VYFGRIRKVMLSGKFLSVTSKIRGFGILEVACWTLIPKLAGSNPTEAVGFFRAKKSARVPSEGK
jgi:hypothetical protein